jgi:DNA (cytosine-5)-methyltransferase 1
MRRIVADVSPRYVFAENVSKNAINQAADDLEKMGYETRCISLSAADLGGDHLRERYWLLAYTDDKGKLLCSINAEVAFGKELQESVWNSYSTEPRVSDGVAYRMDRLKATGNGQVPIVAYTALKLLAEAA